MSVEEVLDDATVTTPAVDIDRARRSVDERAGKRARRRTAVVGTGAVVVVLVAVVAFALTRSDGEPTVAVVVDGTTDPHADVEPGWTLMDEAPIPGRTGHVAVSTGDEMVVWGGFTYDGAARHALGDGAAYSFETGEWREISTAPLSGRGAALAVWTGDEVVVLGGQDGDGRSLLDAAAWDPETDEWRRVPVPGLAAAVGPSAAVWTGDELVVVGGTRSDPEVANPLEVVAIDVVTGEVRELGAVPSPAVGADASVTGSEAWIRRAAAWTGSEVLVVTIDDSHPITIHPLDPLSGDRGDPVVTSVAGLEGSPDGIAWTGEALVVENELGPGAIYRPGSTPEVVSIAASGSSTWFPAAAVSRDAVTVGDRWLDLGSATWHDAEAMPDPPREAPSGIAEGGRYYVWGGDACGAAASCVGLVDPGPGLVWTPPPPG